jgi:hypothetical protein
VRKYLIKITNIYQSFLFASGPAAILPLVEATHFFTRFQPQNSPGNSAFTRTIGGQGSGAALFAIQQRGVSKYE